MNMAMADGVRAEEASVALGFRPRQAPTTISVTGPDALFGEVLVDERESIRSATPTTVGAYGVAGLINEFGLTGEDSPTGIELLDTPGQLFAIENVEFLRRALDLNVDQLGKVAGGASGRSYQDYRSGRTMPPYRIALALEAVAVIGELRRIDPWATKTLFQVDAQALDMLSGRQYESLWGKFVELRNRLGHARQRFTNQVEEISADANLRRIRSLVGTDDFDKALRLLEGLLPETHAWTEKWRVLEGLDLFEAVRRYLEDNEVSESWAFLANFDSAGLAAFRDGAVSLLANPHTASNEWQAWRSAIAVSSEEAVPRMSVAPPVQLGDAAPIGEVSITELMAEGRKYGLPKLVRER